MIPAPPPTLARDLLRGTVLRAGLGTSTVLASMDFETYSEAGHEWDEARGRWVQPRGASGTSRGLPLVGTAVYAQHPSTEVLCMAYNLKDGLGRRLWVPGMPPPQDLFDFLAGGGLIEAWNSAFEDWIWNEVCVRRYGFPPVPSHQFRCAMGKARAWGLPGKLAEAARVLGVPIQKDADGERLLKKFSQPRNPTKGDPRRRILLSDEPEEAQRLYNYCVTDIDTEDEVAARVPDLDADELDFWLADQAINKRGVQIDRPNVEHCAALVEALLERYNSELATLTGGTVQAASEVQKLSGWLGAMGCPVASLDEDSVTEALKRLASQIDTAEDDPFADRVREIDAKRQAHRALEIRQAVGSASVKKVFAMLLQCARGDRLHDLFSYHAARTGRPTGNGPQPTNLPKAGPPVSRCGYDGRQVFQRGCGRYHAASLSACPWCGTMGPPGRREEWCVGAARDALELIATRNIDIVEAVFGSAMQAIAGVLRGLFIAAPGKQLLSSDFTAIEAVVIAALAGEEWRLEVFRKKTDIYLESIARSQGLRVEDLIAHKAQTGKHHPLRQGGKIQELALGFGGWINAVRSMADTLGIEVSPDDDVLKRDILAWRTASPAIVELWGGQTRDFGRTTEYFGMEGASIKAMLDPGIQYPVMRLNGTHTGLSYVLYEGVLYLTLPSGRRIAYQKPWLEQTGTWRGYKLRFMGWNTNPKKGPPGWIPMDLYGGLDAENGTQAVARDIQRHAIVSLERDGLPVVLHVYDEDVCEAEMHRTVEQVEKHMSTMPAWAAGWPIAAAGGWADDRYQKA